MKTKIFQKGGFQLERGKAGGTQAPGWGSTLAALGSGSAIPYLTLGKAKASNSTEDASITSEGFKEVPRKISTFIDQSMSLNNRYEGINPLLYWMLGLEDKVQPVICYVCSTVTADPVPGNTYTDAQAHVCTFLRKEVNKTQTFYIFTQTVSPTLTTGSLTRTSGAGDATLSFTTRSTLLYEHVFKFDPRSRHNIAIPTDEQLSFYAAGDIKCRTALIGVSMDTSLDFVHQNAMCKKMAISSSAGAMSVIDADFLAYDLLRGNYANSTWTYPTGLQDSDGIIMHHDWIVQLGPYAGSLTTVGVTSFNVGSEIPLQVIQDTVSGLHLVEPVMEGTHAFDASIILSRYAATTWQDLTEAWSGVKARLAANQGYLLQEILVNYCIINSSGPDEDAVSKENIKLNVGTFETNNWASSLYGCSMAACPVTLRVRNATQYNQMELT